ncbi:MAG: hypothetical protein Q8L49_00340 [Burkholderiaceae bacterium]|nr:hypothetical protein [Burkholderiaceae bacterium]
MKSRFNIGRIGRPGCLLAQGLDSSDAIGHRPGQPERKVAGLLLSNLDALDAAAIHVAIIP